MGQAQGEKGKTKRNDREERKTSSSPPWGRRRKKSGLQFCYNAVTTLTYGKTTNPDGRELYHTSRQRSSPKIRPARNDRARLQRERPSAAGQATIPKPARERPRPGEVHPQPGDQSRQMRESDVLRRQDVLGTLSAQGTGLDRRGEQEQGLSNEDHQPNGHQATGAHPETRLLAQPCPSDDGRRAPSWIRSARASPTTRTT